MRKEETLKNVVVGRIANDNDFFDLKHARESVETATYTGGIKLNCKEMEHKVSEYMINYL